MLAGCGDVDWFPDTRPAATTPTNAAAPNAFTFTPQSISVNTLTNGVNPVSSNTVTVTGTNTNGWPVTFTSYSGAVNPTAQLTVSDNVGGLPLTSDPGAPIPNVMPNQTLEIDLTPSIVVGTTVTASVTVGTYTTSFAVTTTK